MRGVWVCGCAGVGLGGGGWACMGAGVYGWVGVRDVVGVGVGVDTESTTLPAMQKCIFKEHHALTTKKILRNS